MDGVLGNIDVTFKAEEHDLFEVEMEMEMGIDNGNGNGNLKPASASAWTGTISMSRGDFGSKTLYRSISYQEAV